MSPIPKLIRGNNHTDERGRVSFVNSFDMLAIRRMYSIEPKEIKSVRAWQGHKRESKWFHCTKGRFIVNIIKINDWLSPAEDLPVFRFDINSQADSVLYIPAGYVNGFSSIEEKSSLLVFSDFTLEESKNDDFRFDSKTWKVKW